MERKILSFKDDKINSEVELIEYPAELRGGRNYFSPSRLANLALSSTVVGSTSYKSFYLSVNEGEVYSISRTELSNNRFRYVFTEQEPALGVAYFGGTGNSVTYDNSLKIEGIIVPSNAKYLFLYLTNQNDPIPNIKIEKGTNPTDWTPAPEDLGLSYPDFITEFKPSISDRYILTEELIEYPEELRGGRNLLPDSHFYSGDASNARSYIQTSYSTIRNVSNGIATFEVTNSSGANRLDKVIRDLEVGRIYTYSAKTTISNGSFSSLVGANAINTTKNEIDAGVFIDSLTFRATSSTVTLRLYFGNVGNGIMYDMHWFTLVEGNKGISWTPAPEDLGLSYPDHIQSFGTSFSNNILINEFKEQGRIMIDLDFNKLELGSFNETKPEGSSFQECKYSSIRYTRYNELIKTDGEFEITVDEGFGVNMLFFDENQKYIGRVNGYTGLQPKWFRGSSPYIYLLVGTVPISNLEGVINPNIKITKLI